MILDQKTQNKIQTSNLNHVAIIMDGNRRWAKLKNLPSAMGHKKGVDTLKKVVKLAHKLNIKYLTVYAFSTENWSRSPQEVDFLMKLLANTIKNELNELFENGVRLNFIGDLTKLNKNLQNVLADAVKKTSANNGVNLQIAINYGARDEIINAVNKILKSGLGEVTKEEFTNFLYTKNIPDPDLLIRTGGEFRVSNYLLWQIAYSEIYITNKFWPEFDEEDFTKAVLEFTKRQRRYGK